ncbi:MAG: UDP-3-O-[3-hydroxymyristoyl] N-acetylglucosamine deacetylase [Candidatus Omnitrophica bacterium]|nr:UDP-3-O-[3-hydroxymyristoyl] N-acetylglucosamine deacetylase [Candidatus Omnitrophota bacterium]
MIEQQKTIKREFALTGVGLHTGCKATVCCKPAPADSGISFIRTDLPGRPVIQVDPANIHIDTRIPRCTSIGKGEAVLHTVEHLMSVLCGLGVSNLTVEIDAFELPGLDGSGLDFLKAIKKAGIVEQDAPSPFFEIMEPTGVELNGCSIYVVPDKEFKISYVLDYDNPVLKSQFFNATITPRLFEENIAPARTFCLESEAEELKKNGLGKGANYDNTLVVGKEGVIKNAVRFPDEFVRHKVLDFIGDLYLLGMPIRGHAFAVKSGHTLNIQLLKKIYAQKEKYQKRDAVTGFDFGNKTEIDINGIMSILPHRYPFLLVDRVLEIERGKRGVGVKNVTINDNFFQGHFPARPVMPGVLMVEAMAQTAGVVILTNEAHHGKVAFFLAVDKVRFRRVVVPGDQLVMEVEVIRDRSKTAQVRAIAKVGDEVAAEAEMVFSFTDDSYLD